MLTTVRKAIAAALVPLDSALAGGVPAYSGGGPAVYATNSGRRQRPRPSTPRPTRCAGDRGIETPHGVEFAPDGTRVYISNEADSTLDVVDRKTGKIVRKCP